MDKKNTIKITLEVHAYAEEKLFDEVLEDEPFYGIVGADIMKPLVKKNGCVLDFNYDNDTRIEDIINFVKITIYGEKSFESDYPKYTFTYKKERYLVLDGKQKIIKILKYIDPDNTGSIIVTIFVSYDAGCVASEGKLRYFVRSHESGKHNVPHIHVRDAGYEYEASIRISDGEIIAGTLPTKLANKAKDKILEDQDYFYHCWNTMTDGLKIDINHHYGYIEY